MRRMKTLASVATALVFALVLGGYAYAHPMGFESDLSEDGVVNVCNPHGVRPGMVTTAVKQWNSVTVQGGAPTLGEVTGTGAFCEVTVEERGGAQANFYARVVYGAHPDRLQISRRFTQLPAAQRQGTMMHEFGHVLGLQHPPANAPLCAQSVMTNIAECNVAGVKRRSTLGPHDKADLFKYWVEEPIYPVPNKCWASACSNSGPPISVFGQSSRDSGESADHKEGSGGPSSAVRVPSVIED